MQKVIATHPAVDAYNRVHTSWSRAQYSDNYSWWAEYLETRTQQIANSYKITAPQLIEMWVRWLNEKEAK